MGRITLATDKKRISEGEYITVSWDCQNPDMVSLTVDDGGRSVHQLGDSGSKVLQASGNADRMILTLRASVGGKIEEKSATVKVERKVLKAEKVNRSPRSGPDNRKFDLARIKDWWSRTTMQYKTAWNYLPEEKKLAVKVMGLLAATMLLTAISPKLLPIGLIGLVGYLGWVVMKR